MTKLLVILAILGIVMWFLGGSAGSPQIQWGGCILTISMFGFWMFRKFTVRRI